MKDAERTTLQIAEHVIEKSNDKQFKTLKKTVDGLKGIRKKLEIASGTLYEIFEKGAKIYTPTLATAILDDSVSGELKQRLSSVLSPQEIDLYVNENKYIAKGIIEGLSGVTQQYKIALIFDSLEQQPHLENWLIRSLLVGGLTDNVIIVIGSQILYKKKWRDWNEVISDVELQPFSKNEIELYLDRRNITDNKVKKEIVNESHLLPWAVALLADTNLNKVRDSKEAIYQDVRYNVIQKFLDRVEEENDRELIYLCALPRWFSQDMLGFIWPDLSLETFEQLVNLSFVRPLGKGRWYIHEVVRLYIFHHIMNERSIWFGEKNGKLIDWFKKTAEKLPHERRITYFSEYVFHNLLAKGENSIEDLKKALGALIKYHNIGLSKSLLMDLKRITSDSITKMWLKYFESELHYITNDEKMAEVGLISLTKEKGISHELKSLVLLGLGRTYRRQGKTDDAKRCIEECRNISMTQEDQEAFAKANYILSATYRRLGRWDESIDLCMQSEKIFNKLCIDDEKYWSLSNRGFTEMFRGNFSDSKRILLLAYEELSKNGIKERKIETGRRLGRNLIYMGDWINAEKLLRNALREFEEIDDHYGIGRSENHLGFLLTEMGQFKKAKKHLENAEKVFSNFKAWLQVGMNKSYLGYLYYLTGDFIKGNDLMQKASNLILKVGDSFHTAEYLYFWGNGEYLAKNYNKAESLLNECVESAKYNLEVPYYQALACCTLSSIKIKSNINNEAYSIIRKGKDLATKYELNYNNILAKLHLLVIKHMIAESKESQNKKYSRGIITDNISNALLCSLDYNIIYLYHIFDNMIKTNLLKAADVSFLIETWRSKRRKNHMSPEQQERKLVQKTFKGRLRKKMIIERLSEY